MKKLLYFLLTMLFIVSVFMFVSCSSNIPYIGDNGNWWVGESDLGVPAQGPQGPQGSQGEPGVPGSQGVQGIQGPQGEPGTAGSSVTVVSVSKTKTEGLVDTYTIQFSDGTKTEFTVTNGSDGETVYITSVEKESSDGLEDSYKIVFSDNSVKYFSVTNGSDGLTPYISENGNWWIGDVDTGVFADYEKENDIPLTFYSIGLEYKAVTLSGKSGFVVTGWNDLDLDDNYIYSLYSEEELRYLYSSEGYMNGHLVIPDFIGSIPVIGVADNAGLNFGKVTLSKNSIYLGYGAFYNCSYLKEIDFNNSKITCIPSDCFIGTKLQNIDLPDTVTYLLDYAFKDVPLTSIDLSNVKYIGYRALTGLKGSVYLPDTIEYVGDQALSNCLVYLGHDSIPNSWGSKISLIDNKNIALNCSVSDYYVYGKDGQTVTVYSYLGTQDVVEVPATIEGTTVTKIGYGFANKMSEEVKVKLPSYVKLPNTIKYIDRYAFNYSETFVSVPESIECVSAESGYLAFYGFEGETIPKICEYWIGDSDIYTLTPDQYRDEVRGVRFSLKNDPASIEYDETVRKFYKKDLYGYSLIAVMGCSTSNLVVNSQFNGYAVYMVGTDAFGSICMITEEDGELDIDDNVVETLTFESGITKLQTGSIKCKAKKVFIPKSVTTINAYAFKSVDVFYVEASSKPDEWDTYWANNNQNIYYGVKELFSNYGFTYIVNQQDKVELVKYNFHSDLYIPRTLNGLTVVKIHSGFYTEAGSMTVYIPSCVTTIDPKAFYISSGNSYSYFYIEASSKPDGWASNWALNNNYNTQYNYNSEVPDVYFEGDFAYLETSEITVKLVSYLGNASSVIVPRLINGKTVTGVNEYTFCFDYGNYYYIYIPKTITYLPKCTIYLYSGDSCNIYYEGTSSQLSKENYYCANRNGYNCGTITYEIYPSEE